MTPTPSPLPAMAASIPPTFSYAQAAKGQKSATTTSSTLQSQATSGISTPTKDSHSTSNTPLASVGGAAVTVGSETSDKEINGNGEPATKSDSLGLGVDSDSKSITLVNSIPASPSFGTASTSTLPKEDDLDLPSATPVESIWDRNPRSAAGAEKSAEASEGRRGKKGKKQKQAEREADKEAEREAEKEREEAERKLLVAAPPPAVNIWQQRKEAQALKAKPSQAPANTAHNLGEASASGESLVKPVDSKKKSKTFGGEDGDKTHAPTVVVKDASISSRSQKKGSENTTKAKEDAPNKRAGPRGSRVSDKEAEKSATSLPPPVEDPVSWPTPETALEEEKRKAQEKERAEKEKEARDETASNKARPKEKWMPVPFVPSVTWSTPMPSQRGGRGRGGARAAGRDSNGRGSHASNGVGNGEKSTNGSAVAVAAAGDAESRGRGTSAGTRSSSLPPTKRLSHDANAQGKASVSHLEKAKTGQNNAPAKHESSNESQRISAGTNDSIPDNVKGQKDQIKAVPKDNGSVSASTERRGDGNARGADQPKEAANLGKDVGQSRDRADGRSDRGRGGYRGRGGHNGFPNGQPQPPQHTFTNGHGSVPNGYGPRQSSGPYSPGIAPGPFNNGQYIQGPARGGRGNSRSSTIPSNPVFPRFTQGGGPPLGLQMPNPMYDYSQPQHPMSAMPFSPSSDSSVIALIKMQMEYYFSINNLCKDVFLRKHMDSQGFVFLQFIAGFKRLQTLFNDGHQPAHAFELLRIACYETPEVEIIAGEDGIDRVRRADGWEKWVLDMSARDESVRNDGPTQHIRQDPRERFQYAPPVLPHFQNFPSVPESRQMPNGLPPTPHGMNGNGFHESPVQLAGGAPNFTPGGFNSVQTSNGFPPVSNGTYTSHGTPVDERLQGETTFSDENVQNLTLVFDSPEGNRAAKSGAPFHNASSRTFSHGSIDGSSVAEEFNGRQGPGVINGTHSNEASSIDVRRSRSSFSPISQSKSVNSNGPPVMWVKGQSNQGPLSEDNTEAYTTILAKALTSRELPNTTGIIHVEMKQLYDFWSHFLCRNFNPKMYTDFRRFAYEDLAKNFEEGKISLINYYVETLASKKKVIPDALAEDYVKLVQDEYRTTEPEDDRPALKALRTAWRNGALDLRSRKKIDKLVDQDLRKELES
ncbi:hypothetical protein B0O99DRAFT_32780 [Bisporella sp. PMI_857]|nr:hypothetical protein B0O99DRAFT_32780 [Bisporella sp. PMI_857]